MTPIDFRIPAIFAWGLFFAPGVLLVIISIVRLQADGLTVVGAVLLVIWAWLLGVFTADFWSTPIDATHPDALGSLDEREREGQR